MRSGYAFSLRAQFILLGTVLTLTLLFLSLNPLYGAGQTNVGSLVPQTEQVAAAPLCRFGVNVVGSVEEFDTASLRMGWYVDYRATSLPTSGGAEYAPIIRVVEDVNNVYLSTPRGSALQSAILAHPGAVWLISNEPDRRTFQDDLEPHVYAIAYHDLYTEIKTTDPTSRIFAGNIVQPTAVRLQYLDMVLQSYQSLYGQAMPVDGWGIHNFILNEVSCEHIPSNCWGAEIPPGIDDATGEVLSIQDNDRVDLFVERIERFRQWMFERGYGGLPLYVSEYGINMPDWLGFDSARVNAFMNFTFDYLSSASDPALGNPNDAYKLVQKWSWWSSSHDTSNGWLFDPITKQMTDMGANYASYTANISDDVDLYPASVSAVPPAPFSQGENVTFTLRTVVASSGNLVQPSGSAVVRFYDGDPAGGGAQIGTDHSVSLSGCGGADSVEVVWADVAPGAHQIYVSVDADGSITESDEQNNVVVQTIVVATFRNYLAVIRR